MGDSRPVVALYHHLPPGGADRAAYELVRRTNDQYRYVLFTVDPSNRDPFAGANRAPLDEVVDTVHRRRAPVGGATRLQRWGRAVPALVRAERDIAAEIDEADADVAVVHHQRFLQAPSLLRRLTTPSLYICQEPRRRSFEYDLRHAGDRSLLRRVAETPFALIDRWAAREDVRNTRAADAIACNSDHSREYIWRAYGRDAAVLRLGADQDVFRLPSSPGRDNEILAVGSLDPSKGHALAIEALATLPEGERPALRIVHNRADSREAVALEHLAEQRGVTLVLEANPDDETIVERYQRARAVIATGRVEPLGLTPLEAMACGTLVVAVREGGYRETVTPGVTGELADREPAALGRALRTVLDRAETADRTAIRQIAAAAWNWDIAAAQYADQIDRLLDEGPVDQTIAG